jgi:cbb3-type cytochrome oxidase subunit 3
VADTVREAARFVLQRESFRAMNQRTLQIRLALIVVGVVVLFAGALPAMAQSCALCYTQAASAGSRMIEALKSGILILIVPPTLMSIAMVFIMYRNRNRCRNAADAAESDAIWNRTDLSIATTTPWHPPTR